MRNLKNMHVCILIQYTVKNKTEKRFPPESFIRLKIRLKILHPIGFELILLMVPEQLKYIFIASRGVTSNIIDFKKKFPCYSRSLAPYFA